MNFLLEKEKSKDFIWTKFTRMMQLYVIDPIIEPVLFQEWQLIRLCPYSVLLVLEPTKIATYVRTLEPHGDTFIYWPCDDVQDTRAKNAL